MERSSRHKQVKRNRQDEQETRQKGYDTIFRSNEMITIHAAS